MTITTQIELGLLLDVEAEAEGYVPARRNGSGEPGPAGWDAPDGGWVGAPRIVLEKEQQLRVERLLESMRTKSGINAPGFVASILDILTDGDFSKEAEERLAEEIPG